ncbi:hypothetical protein [Leptospira bandrabouensis]|uniref:hypothetical protein n=1 Tax=Leptospira bandrabouensis TaxID=2484903 RepID=UPI001EE79DA2|nr:hypothetical protein [Leptospira bandrabouensis]MCG6145376.1 hypothetical protein [Leptospira bandrabouensis]MCG6161000.1 hypothetical protein [Leptospira bandrabouensis]MCG6164876.1 hypothetical protein [Leptospira bandrabouensis]
MKTNTISKMFMVFIFFFSCMGHEEQDRKMLCKESFLLSAIAIEQQPQREIEKTERLFLNIFDYQLCVKDAKEDSNRSTPML